MKVLKNYNLRAHNTFRMDVSCACFIEYDSASELESLDWDSLPKPVRHIGAGSNLLFSGNFPGTILHSKISFLKYVDMGFDEVPVMVGSGVVWDDFVAQTCSHGLWGAENLSLIPGEVGAAAVQNIGAYGAEIKDIISGVVCFDVLERRKVKFGVAECEYGYRDSFFKRNPGRYVVTSVLMRLCRTPKPRLDYKGLSETLAKSLECSGDGVERGFGDGVKRSSQEISAGLSSTEGAQKCFSSGGSSAEGTQKSLSSGESSAEGAQKSLSSGESSAEGAQKCLNKGGSVEEDPRITPQMVRDAVISLRNSKLPDPAVLGSAGSFFKNPVVGIEKFQEISKDYDNVPHYLLDGGDVKIPAAWLIDNCGLKGCSIGGAQVYERQPLVIVNASGAATPSDVTALCEHIRSCVLTHFGINLFLEVELL